MPPRKSQVKPRVMFKLLVCAYLKGVYSGRKIEELCRENLQFIWLPDGQHVPDHCAIARFRSAKQRNTPLRAIICHLDHYATYTETAKSGEQREVTHYRCENCTDCPYRAACCKAKDVNQPKEVAVCREFRKLREVSLSRITTNEGKLLRVNRSIQAEGAFGQLKHNRSFKRFLTGGSCKVTSELHFLALPQNIARYLSKCKKDALDCHLCTPKTLLKS